MMPARLARAYRQTEYSAAGCIVLIGRRAPDRLFQVLGAYSAVFITAWNQQAQRRLRERLRRFGSVPADGTLGRWHEAHLLVSVADMRPMVRLARIFRQRAVVVIQRGHPAKLVVVA
jgi:hypothetical protein